MNINEFTYSKEFQELDHSDMTLVLRMKLKAETGQDIAELIKSDIINMLHVKEFRENINFIY